jgi:hypothetical protein
MNLSSLRYQVLRHVGLFKKKKTGQLSIYRSITLPRRQDGGTTGRRPLGKLAIRET